MQLWFFFQLAGIVIHLYRYYCNILTLQLLADEGGRNLSGNHTIFVMYVCVLEIKGVSHQCSDLSKRNTEHTRNPRRRHITTNAR